MTSEQAPDKEATLCGAKKTKGGGTCTLVKGFGTSHVGYGRCKHHGGSTPAGVISAERERVRTSILTYGGPIEVEPGVALLQEVHRTAGHVAYLGTIVADLEKAQLTGPVGSEGVTEGGIIMHPAYKPSVWLEMYHTERTHLARVCKMALDAGVAERQVRVAEQQGELFAGAIRAILTDLGVMGDPRAPEIVRRHLMALPSGEPEHATGA